MSWFAAARLRWRNSTIERLCSDSGSVDQRAKGYHKGMALLHVPRLSRPEPYNVALCNAETIGHPELRHSV